VYAHTHKTILQGLEAGLRVSEGVKPRGLVKLVKAELQREIGLVKLGEHFRHFCETPHVFKWRIFFNKKYAS
jgi:hypothetical protein